MFWIIAIWYIVIGLISARIMYVYKTNRGVSIFSNAYEMCGGHYRHKHSKSCYPKQSLDAGELNFFVISSLFIWPVYAFSYILINFSKVISDQWSRTIMAPTRKQKHEKLEKERAEHELQAKALAQEFDLPG
jgi:hypothetical protein